MSEYQVNGCGCVSNAKVYGLDESIIRSKYPKSVDITKCTADVTPGVEALGNCQTGTGHDQFLTGIVVQFDLTFTIKAWTEAERYHFLDFVSSQSTMHKIAQFDIAKQRHEYVDPEIIKIVQMYVNTYNVVPTPDNYLRLLYNVPVGFKLTAGMTTNYRQLKTIYQQRKAHRLPEWRELCQWIETLPKFKELCLKGEQTNICPAPVGQITKEGVKSVKQTQRAKIVAYCKAHGSITARDAYVELDINSPRKRISELRRSGFNVDTVTEYRENANGIEVRYNRYFITEAVKQ